MGQSEVGDEQPFITGLRGIKRRAEFATADGHDFRHGEFEQTLAAARDAEAAALASAKWHAGIAGRNDHVVEADDADVELRREPVAGGFIAGENARTQRIGTIVCAGHGFVVVRDGDERKHGGENVFAQDAEQRRNAGQNDRSADGTIAMNRAGDEVSAGGEGFFEERAEFLAAAEVRMV